MTVGRANQEAHSFLLTFIRNRGGVIPIATAMLRESDEPIISSVGQNQVNLRDKYLK